MIDSEMHKANTNHPQRKKMNLSRSTGSTNTRNGIWESTTRKARKPKKGVSFRTAISKMSIAVHYFRPKAGPDNTNITTSKTRRTSCTG